MPLVNNNAPAQMAAQFETLVSQFNSAVASAESLWGQIAGIPAALRWLHDQYGTPFTGALSAELASQVPSAALNATVDIEYGKSLFDSYNV